MPHIITKNDVFLLDQEEFLFKTKLEKFLSYDLEFSGSGDVLDLDETAEFPEITEPDTTKNFGINTTTQDSTAKLYTTTMPTVKPTEIIPTASTSPVMRGFDEVSYFYETTLIVAPIVLFLTLISFSIYVIVKYKNLRKNTGKYNPQEIEEKLGISQMETYPENSKFATRYNDQGLYRFLQLPVEERLI